MQNIFFSIPTDDHNEPRKMEIKCLNMFMSQNEISMHSILRPAACCYKTKLHRLHMMHEKNNLHIKLKNKLFLKNFPTSSCILSTKGVLIAS